MKVIKRLEMDLLSQGHTPYVDTMQEDACRWVELSLYEGGTPWTIPEGVTAAVAYRKPDGKKGLYDTLPDGSAACILAGNVVLFALPPQALTTLGQVAATVVFWDTGLNPLSTFEITLRVQESPAVGALKSEDYLSVRQCIVADAENLVLKWIADGTISGPPGPPGDSITVAEVSESSEDGGENVVKFSDGKQLLVKNGRRGAPGKDPIKGVDYFTPEDKEEIAAMVIKSLGGSPVFGYVDENNTIVVSGELSDGSYSVKYEMSDGSTIDIGDMVLDSTVYLSITNTLTNCSNSNDAAQVAEGSNYTATISPNVGYVLSTVSVTMGGTDITVDAVNGGNINIAKVTGDIMITAVAAKPNYTNLANPSDSNWKEGKRLNSQYAEVDAPGMVTTNLIAAAKGDVIRVKGLSFGSTSNERVCQYLDGTANNAIVSTVNKDLFSTSGDVTTITLDGSAVMANSTHVRICGTLTGTSADVIITVGEDIA